MAITPTDITYYHETERGESSQDTTLGMNNGISIRQYDLAPSSRALTTADILGTEPLFCGTATIDTAFVPNLVRTLPLQDPQFPNYWCTRCYAGHGVGKQTPQAPSGVVLGYPLYDRWRFNAQFELVPYNILSDLDAAAASTALGGPAAGYPVECMRWFNWEVVPDVTVLQAPGGQFKFAETSTPKGPSLTPPGTVFLGYVNLIQGKSKINFKWYDVPEQLVSDGFGVYPHFDAAIGKVNDAPFLGFPKGTLLLEPYQITRKKYNTLSSGTPNNFLVDVTFPMIYYSPPSGVTSPTNLGHNLLPWKLDWKYYLATVDGTTSGKATYEYYTFTKLFEYYTT